jgi:hypothetical protein
MHDFTNPPDHVRSGFSPQLAAISAWQAASGAEPSDAEAERILLIHFRGHASPGYVQRYNTLARLGKSVPRAGNRRESEELIRGAFVEAESALRKLIVATSVRGTFSSDEDFETDQTYATAMAYLEKLEHNSALLAKLELARCPRCATVGEVVTWFGKRLMHGKSVRQSWCRVCRATDSSSSNSGSRRNRASQR